MKGLLRPKPTSLTTPAAEPLEAEGPWKMGIRYMKKTALLWLYEARSLCIPNLQLQAGKRFMPETIGEGAADSGSTPGGEQKWGMRGSQSTSHTFISPGRGLKNSSLEKISKRRGKTSIYWCVCVCEVPRKESAQKSVLPKESSSANYPSHACRNFNLVSKLLISVLLPYCQI